MAPISRVSEMLSSPLAVGLGLSLAAACNRNVSEPFPLADGFAPLEACTAAVPDPVADDPFPEVQTSLVGTRDGHDFAHSRAYVHATLAEVWAAMQVPAVCRIHGTNSWSVKNAGAEPFPMSFVIHYTAGPSYYTVDWEDTYRGGVLAGTAAEATAYGMRGQKTWGTSFVSVQSISVGAQPVGGEANAVALAMVGWLNATDSGQADAAGMLSDLYQGLLAQVHGGNPLGTVSPDGGSAADGASGRR